MSITAAAASGSPKSTAAMPGGAALSSPSGTDSRNPTAPPARTYSQASDRGIRD